MGYYEEVSKQMFSVQYIAVQYTCYTMRQGYNARKVISEMYASFVLQCTVSGW